MNMIKKITSGILALGFIAFTSAFVNTIDNKTVSTDWELDKAHTTIKFEINHFFTPVTGTFDDADATVVFDPNNLGESSIDVTIPVDAINTRNERRDNHLKSEDFFNAEKWPNITFSSERIERRGENQFVARGQLTIRDQTKDFDLPFRLLGIMDHPMQDVQVAGIVAETSLMRTDYNVGVGDWAATMVVGDEVTITLNLELNAPKS